MTATETLGHTTTQPGLRGHSWDPENDLLKRYVVAKKLPGGGTLWLASFDDLREASDHQWDREEEAILNHSDFTVFVVIDQYPERG